MKLFLTYHVRSSRSLEVGAHAQNGSVTAVMVRHQVDRILQSRAFGGSELLRNLFSFLAEHSLEKPNQVIKEYDLATTVLGRPESFDARLDSAVRVHTARLRAKLAEYYMSEGIDDAILIEVPKGSHHITWRPRCEAPGHASALEPEIRRAMTPNRMKWLVAGFAIAFLAGAGLVYSLSSRPATIPSGVKAFWQPFLEAAQPPIIVFSNHRFAGSSATGLRSFREGIDQLSDLNDTYSGTGTVMAVGELSSLFCLAGRSPRLKRAELLTWDEARDANVIFLGAPEANSRLGEIAVLQQFAFKSSREEPRLGTGGIVNLHPGPGEDAIYFGAVRPYTSDYAVIALLPNLNPAHKLLVLAGTNTYGGQAAAELVTRADLLEDLRTRLAVPKSGRMPDFEALISVSVNGGVPIQPRIVKVCVHTPAFSTR